MEATEIKEIIGLVPVHVDQTSDEITMEFSDGSLAKWFHWQDCCETVVVDDVVGDWSDLYGNPLIVAEERSNSSDDVDDYESHTWTFYTFRGNGGSVDVKWHGSSNGYYSERVDFTFTLPEPPKE